MSADALFTHWITPARRRSAADTLTLALPLLLAAATIGWRLAGPIAAIATAAIALVIALLIARQRAARFDLPWLIRTLDATRPELEDSSALLFPDCPPLFPLQSLQRTRIAARLDQHTPEDLVPAWSKHALLLLCLAAAILIAAALLWLRAGENPPLLAPSSEGIPAKPGIPRLVAQNLRIIPPAYTGLPVRDSASLDARAPQGSRLEWTLRFDPQASAPKLLMLGGQPLALRRDGPHWIASHGLEAAFLYRVDPASGHGPIPPLHRVDAIPDAPPQVKPLTDSLTLVKPGQHSWTPVFAVTDDYGVAATARLRVTLAIGEGENVTFTEREIAVTGGGPARDRRFAPRLDFPTFGFAAGGDMVVQLIVRDNRSPSPQEVRGPSLILRWPSPKQPESSGLTGMVNTTLPAYFRSQRQIIIDIEKLLREKRGLAPDRFLSRSTAIGGDQQILRGRYSQFLGGESEGQPELPTADADGHHDGDGHDHGGPPQTAPTVFGEKEDVLAEFGHPHDESPASSLDPETRAILKQAVDEMWQSERDLKTGRPDAALPYAYRALRFIKEVQQATRIFLSRVGPELPPIDATRRMTGKRDGLASRQLEITPVERQDGPAAAAWRALGAGPDAIRGPVNLAPLEGWVRANAVRLPDALALSGAIDAVRRDPACTPCRTKLRAQLWSAMERPFGQPARRRPADASGARYLRAIEGGAP
ncbi:DUF4175 domain-containing protein [Sphingobium sp. BYY-5]|uniref:DUF4175 domain-containing protein n=1 Tax=Sphingobium sp. BYY-5 TaxID=2926400 RepID=UPI001FA7B24F|nr:DUF4175 domain-containing protein [Sphingobium sp. BYY-5]MCI4589316.1 DUF4175 domain-containing protein [Sphingobium sp. BYY-5]